MSHIDVVGVPAFEDNYLWVIHNATDAVVVDPGDAAPVIDYLAAHELTLAAVLVTHHHPDHIGGIGALVEWSGADVPVHATGRHEIPHRTHAVGEGDAIRIDALGLDFHVMAVPGHTASHIAFHVSDRRWLFCGDTLFAGGCGRLLGGTAAQLFASLSRIAALPDDTAVYCAHEYTLANLRFAEAVEPDNTVLHTRIAHEKARRAADEPTVPTRIGIERLTNPFLRCDIQEVKNAVQRAFPDVLPSNAAPELVFTQLRKWKNNF